MSNCVWRISRRLYKIIIAVIAITPIYPNSAFSSEISPFGIKIGSQPSNYERAEPPGPYSNNNVSTFEKIFGNPASDYVSSQYIVPPDPHPVFTAYMVESSKLTGICLVTAISSSVGWSSLDKNSSIRDLFKKIKKQIDMRYGESEVVKDYSARENLLIKSGIISNKSTIVANWKTSDQFFDENKTVSINLRYTTGDPYEVGDDKLYLTYKSPKYEECQLINAGSDAKSMTDGSSKF